MRARTKSYIEPLIVRPDDGAAMLGVGRNKFREWMKDGTLDVVELGPNSTGVTVASIRKKAEALPKKVAAQ